MSQICTHSSEILTSALQFYIYKEFDLGINLKFFMLKDQQSIHFDLMKKHKI